jgi:hypothetical protein
MESLDKQVEANAPLRVRVLLALSNAILLNTTELANTKQNAPISRVAWLARNSLELLIWTEYCAISPDNCKRFYLDALRDWIDVAKNVTTIINETQDLRTLVGNSAINCTATFDFGIPEKPQQSFIRIRDAAKETGKLSYYAFINKVLSKFIHPTALSVFLPMSNEERARLRSGFAHLGIEMAKEADEKIQELARQERIAPKPSAPTDVPS